LLPFPPDPPLAAMKTAPSLSSSATILPSGFLKIVPTGTWINIAAKTMLDLCFYMLVIIMIITSNVRWSALRPWQFLFLPGIPLSPFKTDGI